MRAAGDPFTDQAGGWGPSKESGFLMQMGQKAGHGAASQRKRNSLR